MLRSQNHLLTAISFLRIPLTMGIVIILLNQHVAAQNLDEALLAGLPVVVIETVNGEEPTYEEVNAPKGCWGKSIKNATKVPGHVQIYDSGGLCFDSGEYVEKESGMTIKVRGNTSALKVKKSYKIKLQKKDDMLGRGNSFKDKDWLLLKVWNMNTPIGMMVNKLCGLQWTPQYMFVNVVMNGDFRGLYTLTESVDRNADCRLNVDKSTGFIAELDAYWWNEDYYIPSSFKEPMNYTFKYPDSDELTDEQKTDISGALERMEQSLADGSYETTIDVESFARWMLAHDILGNADGGGSNVFLTRHDNVADTLIRMACLWDFDNIMYANDKWDDAHDRYFFHSLWNSPKDAFTKQYVSLWQSMGDEIYQGLTNFFDGLIASDLCQAIDSSVVLNNKRWDRSDRPVTENIKLAREYFSKRWQWLNQAISELADGTNGVEQIADNRRQQLSTNLVFDLQGRRVAQPAKGLYICDGKKILVK